MSLTRILFGFHGRIRRTTYWLAIIGSSVAVGVALAFLTMVATMLGVGAGAVGGSEDEAGAAALGIMSGAALFWLFPLWIASLWIGLALAVKRCHDRNYPGVMILVSLLPVIGWLWAVIDLGFIDGTPGPNQYGPSPKGIAGPQLVYGAPA